MDAQTNAQPDAREVLARDPRVGRQLLGYVLKKVRNASRATEVAHEAIARVLEGGGFCRWEPASKSLLDHLSYVADSILGNQSQKAWLWREQRVAEGDAERQPDSAPSPEQQLSARQELAHKRQLAARVMERMGQDPIIKGMLEHEGAGIHRASELAALLHCSVKDIHRARERLAYRRDQVLEEDRQQEEKRMNQQTVSP